MASSSAAVEDEDDLSPAPSNQSASDSFDAMQEAEAMVDEDTGIAANEKDAADKEQKDLVERQKQATLLEILKDYQDALLFEHSLTPDVARACLDIVKSIPYSDKSIVRKVEEATTGFITCCEACPTDDETLDDLERRKVSLQQEAKELQEKETTEEEKQQLSLKKNEIADLQSKMDPYQATKDAEFNLERTFRGALKMLTSLIREVEPISTTLNMAAYMSQAEASTRSQTLGTNTLNAVEEYHDNFGPGAEVAGNKKEIRDLFTKAKPLDLESLLVQSKNQGNTSYQSLQGVAKHWSSVLLSCNKIATTKEEIASTIERMLDADNPKSEPAEDFAAPGFASTEVQCMQPLMNALFERIGLCWQGNEIDNASGGGFSPFKIKPKPNQIIPPTSDRLKRIVDVCLQKPSRHHLVMLDAALKLCMEIKPWLRSGVNRDGLDLQSMEQIIASLAKYVYSGLNLWSIGVPTFATGLTGTLSHITVLKLELSMQDISKNAKAWSGAAKLQLFKSEKLPLMTEECFDHWTKMALKKTKDKDKKKAKQDIQELKKELYGTDAPPADNDIPKGIWVLWNLMALRRHDLFGPDYKEMFKKFNGGVVGELLGAGTFGMVFRSTEAEESVLKVPLFPTNPVHFNNEEAILEKLRVELGKKPSEKDNIGLPMLQSKKKLKAFLGGLTKDIPALAISPVGMPIVYYIQKHNPNDKALIAFSAQLENALNFIHKMGVTHNDVSPKNIVVYQGEVGSERVCLVDFGCATDGAKEKTGFVGTPLFTHRTVFSYYPRKPWKPTPKFDLFALGLTIAALFNRGAPSWTMGRFPVSTDTSKELKDLVIQRYTKAETILMSQQSKDDVKEKWIGWISTERAVINMKKATAKKKKNEDAKDEREGEEGTPGKGASRRLASAKKKQKEESKDKKEGEEATKEAHDAAKDGNEGEENEEHEDTPKPQADSKKLSSGKRAASSTRRSPRQRSSTKRSPEKADRAQPKKKKRG